MWQARISPNGRWMSFVYESTGVAVSTGPSALPPQGLALVPASGATSRKNWTLLAKEFSWIDKPRWSSDGKTLYFMGRRGESPFNVWGLRIDPATGRPIDTAFRIYAVRFVRAPDVPERQADRHGCWTRAAPSIDDRGVE